MYKKEQQKQTPMAKATAKSKPKWVDSIFKGGEKVFWKTNRHDAFIKWIAFYFTGNVYKF